MQGQPLFLPCLSKWNDEMYSGRKMEKIQRKVCMVSDISRVSMEWVKDNKDMIIDRFCSLDKYPSVGNPFTLLMAGCPGAGKTEFSKKIIKALNERSLDPVPVVHIDADAIKSMIPCYDGANSPEVHAAACVGMEKIFDHVQGHGQNAIVDSTFGDFEKSSKNVERALGRARGVAIFFIYQEPRLAWAFTKLRERDEGRHVPREIFIRAFIDSKENVNELKRRLGERIEVYLIIKNTDNTGVKKAHFNIRDIDNYLPVSYTRADLERVTNEDILQSS